MGALISRKSLTELPLQRRTGRPIAPVTISGPLMALNRLKPAGDTVGLGYGGLWFQ